MLINAIPMGAVPVRGEKVSADASTAVAFGMYTSYDGVAYTITSTGTLYITALSMVTDSNITVDIFDDVATSGTVNTGERFTGGIFAANGGIAMAFHFPLQCKLGSTPKIKASGAGNVTALIHGYVIP